MKKMRKKWMVLLVTMMMVFTMETPVFAAVSKACKGSLKTGLTYVTAGVYSRKFFISMASSRNSIHIYQASSRKFE